MRRKANKEPNLKCFLIAWLIGPAYLLDGIIITLTAGQLIGGLALNTSRWLALTRMGIRK